MSAKSKRFGSFRAYQIDAVDLRVYLEIVDKYLTYLRSMMVMCEESEVDTTWTQRYVPLTVVHPGVAPLWHLPIKYQRIRTSQLNP